MKKCFFIILLIILSILVGVLIVARNPKKKIAYSTFENLPEISSVIKSESENENVNNIDTKERQEVEKVNKENTNEKKELSSSIEAKSTKEEKKVKTKVQINNRKKEKDATKEITTTNMSEKEPNTINKTASKNDKNSSLTQNDETKVTKKIENNKHIHSVVGTSGMWVTSVDEIIKEWDRLSNYYEELLNENKITWEEYCQKCPNGYTEVIHCITDLNENRCKYITWDWQYVN